MNGTTLETYAYARSRRPGDADVPLSNDYLKAVAKVESSVRNQSGADKTWVEEGIRAWERHYGSAVRSLARDMNDG